MVIQGMNFRAGMFVYALAVLLGVVLLQQQSELPGMHNLLWLLTLLIAAAIFLLYTSLPFVYRDVAAYIKPELRLGILLISLILMGFLQASYHASLQLSYRLNDDLIGRDLLVSGYVSNLPSLQRQVQRFQFTITSYRVVDPAAQASDQGSQLTGSGDKRVPATGLPRKVRLSWYHGEPVAAADHGQLLVRMKPPHGFSNPGGFDYEGWLLQQGLDATGYVRKSDLNRLQPANVEDRGKDDVSLLQQLSMRLLANRQRLSDFIGVVAEKNKDQVTEAYSLIAALAIGDKSAISQRQWQTMKATGTSHLMAISGLHIGLASLFAYLLVRPLVPASIIKYVPAQQLAIFSGLVCALLYALLAGFTVPTQRALIMLSVLSGMLLLRRNHRAYDALGFALFIILIFDPMAVLSAGFWFSFAAVAVIFLSVAGNDDERLRHDSKLTSLAALKLNAVAVIKRWLRLQLSISLFLLPLSLYMFQQASLISPLANLLLIPYMSFLVVPLVLLSLGFVSLSPWLSQQLFELAASMLDRVWPLLTVLSELPFASWQRGGISLKSLILITSILLIMYFSRKLSALVTKRLFDGDHRLQVQVFIMMTGAMLLLPLFIVQAPEMDAGEYRLTVLDVGQGSANVLSTRNHSLVFDAGARFSDRFDAGSHVVIPYLRSQGIEDIDMLIISHGDADHIGGAQAVIDAYPAAWVVGQGIKSLAADIKMNCVEGYSWRWDEVDFRFLSGDIDPATISTTAVKPHAPHSRNNSSCVLQVSSESGRTLFTGDIEKQAEQGLLQRYGQQLKSDVLLVPHHGSKTSSTRAFIEAVAPGLSIISVGYRNRYRLPNNKVHARYEAVGGKLWRTDFDGAISVRLGKTQDVIATAHRQQAKRYWSHQLR